MQTSNYLPYTIDLGFKHALRNMGGRSRYAKFMQRYAHRKARQAIRSFLHSKREREPSKYKFFVTGWTID